MANGFIFEPKNTTQPVLNNTMAAALLLEDPLLSDLLPVIKTATGNIQKPQDLKSKNILEIISEEDVQMRILAEQGSALRLTIKRGDGSSIGTGSP